MKTAFVNGEFCNLADAKVSIFDRGFLFGDAVYEVLPIYHGQPFFVDKHIKRLNSNLEKIKIKITNFDWNILINRLILENGGGDLQIYIHVTRGNQGVRKHDIPSNIHPSIIAFTLHNSFPTQEEKKKGLIAKILDDIRWQRCDIKTTSLLANILLNDEAISSGYHTSILVRDGLITEGSTSNVFVVNKEGIIKSPSLNHLCLPGVTRQIAIELMQQLEWDFNEAEISAEELLSAHEVWITSTTKEIYPVIQIDNALINNGKPGEYWRTINQLYQELVS